MIARRYVKGSGTSKARAPSALLAVCAMLAGCGGSGAKHAAHTSQTAPAEEPEHALKVYIGPEGQRKLLKIRPLDETAYDVRGKDFSPISQGSPDAKAPPPESGAQTSPGSRSLSESESHVRTL